jgi:hypothetical protein
VPVLGWLLVAAAIFTVDAVVRGSSPVAAWQYLLAHGRMPPKTAHPVTVPGGETIPPGGGTPLPSSGDWVLGSNDGYTGGTYDEPGMSRPPGNVDSWIGQASQALQAAGQLPLSAADVSAVRIIINGESGGDPLIVNGWDRNAQQGHASKGLMQDIRSTFQRWALPGRHNIFNPVDNIAASVLYARNKYGSLDQVPGVVSVRSGGPYVGY